MATGQEAAKGQDQDQEQEGDESQHEQLVDGLESHDAGPDTDKTAAAPGHAEEISAEGKPDAKGKDDHGKDAKAGGDHPPENQRNAVDAINDKVAKARTKMYQKGEKRRLETQKQRITARGAGADWTATEIANVIKKNGPQEVLRAIGARKPALAIQVMKTANAWDPWVATLGFGKLHNASGSALDLMVMDSIITGADLKTMFKVRWNVDIADGAAPWTDDNIRVTWRQISTLPPNDVKKNTCISILTANAGVGGGTYASGSKTIDLGMNGGDDENLTETVRHEVGHGVHEELKATVDPWLKNDIGFENIPDFKTFIDELGGFPANFQAPDGTTKPYDDTAKGAVVTLLDKATGSASWSPVGPVGTGEDPYWQAAWNGMGPAVKNAFTQSKTNWFSNFENFQKKNGHFYFLNHWYHKPMKFSSKAANVINATNDRYAAMSDKEFFATSYAEYFRDPAGAKDHKKWGGNLPGSVKGFFKEAIVQRQPYDKLTKSKRVKHT